MFPFNNVDAETEYIKNYVKNQQANNNANTTNNNNNNSNNNNNNNNEESSSSSNDTFVSNQVTLYKNGATTTAQANKRPGESESELDRKLRDGWSRSPQKGAGTSNTGASSVVGFETALATARSLYAFFPESVLRKYAEAWIKYDDTQLAIAETRNSSEWKSEFGFLRREDGSLIMSEAEAMSAKASYAETLSDVGITHTQ